MASLVSVAQVDEVIDGRAYPAGEVLLSLTMKEARWLREVVNRINIPDGEEGEHFNAPDYEIWRALSHSEISGDQGRGFKSLDGSCATFGRL